MHEPLEAIRTWLENGQRFSVAIVVKTWGSSPRPVGSVMAIRADGFVVGSVSGGCVEGAVISEAMKTEAAKLLEFGAISDEEFWAVGLSCGGEIHVLVLPSRVLDASAWREFTDSKEAVALAIALDQEQPVQTLYGADLSSAPPLLREAVEGVQSSEVALEGQRYFVLNRPRPDRLLIVGAVHIAISLLKFARELGFHTTLVDPRATLADEARFPVLPDETHIGWPQQVFAQVPLDANTYVAILTHDPKIDDVALELLLRRDVAYIGALGGRVTQGKRRKQLLEKGFTEAEIARISGPIGLAIGARTPEEIALSIIAEIVQVRNSRLQVSETPAGCGSERGMR